MEKSKRILIIYHSVFGHVEQLAKVMLKGVNSVDKVKGELWRIPETLSPEILTKMKAPRLDVSIPAMTFDKLEELTKADGFLFGTPTRYGMMSGQSKTFWDMTGGLWVSGGLYGKPAGLFFSTSTQAGGQETTAHSYLTHFAHHGMIFVPLGYALASDMSDLTEVRGGSAYGAGTLAGSDNSRKPSERELRIAKFQGEQFAKFVNRLI